MVLKLVEKPVYRFIFGPGGSIPLMDTQIMFEEDITAFFQTQRLMQEDIRREYKAKGILTEKTATSHSDVGTNEEIEQDSSEKSFEITYENPITGKTESLNVRTETISTRIKDPIEKTMEMGSTYPVYKYITSPIVTTKVNPYILEEIKRNTEIVSPDAFGGGMIIPVAIITKAKKSEIVEKEKEEQIVGLKEVHRRGRIIEGAIDEKIIMIQDAVNELRNKKPLDEIIEKLPRKARALLFIRLRNKRKVNNKIIELLLLDDLKFLEELKVKIKGLDVKDLVKIAKEMRKLTKKKK